MSDALFQLDCQHREGYLFVMVHGELSRQADPDIDIEILAEYRRRGYRGVLIDIRPAEGRLDLCENYEAAVTLRRRVSGALRRTAIVNWPANDENNALFELAARNRGAQIRFIHELPKAVQWLLSGGETA